MKATAELQFVPIGRGVSVRKEITRVIELLNEHDFILETHDKNILQHTGGIAWRFLHWSILLAILLISNN